MSVCGYLGFPDMRHSPVCTVRHRTSLNRGSSDFVMYGVLQKGGLKSGISNPRNPRFLKGRNWFPNTVDFEN